ncbi:MAG: REP-associated tyrosine transposase [Candidatus Acidiferrales bacterium]
MSRLKNFSLAEGTHLLTTHTSLHRQLLQSAQRAELLEGIVFEYRDAGEYLVHAYAIMPDHLHLLATTARAKSPAKIMQLIKGRFSYELKKQYGAGRSAWQEGFAGRQIVNPSQFCAAVKYIEENPVKAELCDSPVKYRYCSASGRYRMDPMPDFGAKARKSKEASVMSPLKRRPQ